MKSKHVDISHILCFLLIDGKQAGVSIQLNQCREKAGPFIHALDSGPDLVSGSCGMLRNDVWAQNSFVKHCSV